MNTTPRTDALLQTGTNAEQLCEALDRSRQLERELAAKEHELRIEQEQHNRSIKLAIDRQDQLAAKEKELEEVMISHAQETHRLQTLQSVAKRYHEAWNLYKVFPSLSNEKLFAKTESAYNSLPPEVKGS